jgi:hypothetical protein
MRRYRIIFLLIVLLLVCASSFSAPILANNNPPKRIVYTSPDRKGTPSASNQTGSRGCCPNVEIPLLALGGALGYTSTVSELPTFWFYIPYTSDSHLDGKLVLQYESGQTIEEIPVSLPTTPKIIPIRIEKSLQVDRPYRWYLDIKCSSSSQCTGSIVITGTVKRVLLTRELENSLKVARSSEERVEIYARNGIWYDTVTELAQLYLATPAWKQTWQDFLRDAGLGSIVEASVDGFSTDRRLSVFADRQLTNS